MMSQTHGSVPVSDKLYPIPSNIAPRSISPALLSSLLKNKKGETEVVSKKDITFSNEDLRF